ncbi:MAG: VanZ family protein [Acidobacteria bacterium]|nr:VanZ family protein [Acidobacteriota bacterium]MCA1619830.1 VanZ family protein [Acidobacteriota bacterium]
MSFEKDGLDLEATARRGRLWRYGPVVAWACFVLFASSSNFSASNTSRIIRPLLLWLFPGISEASLAPAHFFVRKAAHFTEYAVLALLAARAFRTSSRAALARRWWPASFILIAAVALVDEYHQSFVPVRTGTAYDSLLDMAGGATALAGAALWHARREGKSADAARGG